MMLKCMSKCDVVTITGQRKPCVNGDTSFLWEPRLTLWLFSRLTSGGQTQQTDFDANGSNDVHSRKDDTFA